jgi:hypothetical protein
MMCCGVGIPGGFNTGVWDSRSIGIEQSKANAAGNVEFGVASGNAGSGQTGTSSTSAGGHAVMVAALDAVSNGNGQVLAGDYGYIDANVSIGFGPTLYYLGLTGGVQFTNSGWYPYVGGGFVYSLGASGALTVVGSVMEGW